MGNGHRHSPANILGKHFNARLPESIYRGKSAVPKNTIADADFYTVQNVHSGTARAGEGSFIHGVFTLNTLSLPNLPFGCPPHSSIHDIVLWSSFSLSHRPPNPTHPSESANRLR